MFTLYSFKVCDTWPILIGLNQSESDLTWESYPYFLNHSKFINTFYVECRFQIGQETANDVERRHYLNSIR
jgi:hypothetical protein